MEAQIIQNHQISAKEFGVRFKSKKNGPISHCQGRSMLAPSAFNHSLLYARCYFGKKKVSLH